MIDVSSENIYASKLFDQFDLEGGPVRDVVERSSFSKRDGLKGESYFNHIRCSGQVEPVQDVRQPGVKIRRFSIPGRSIELRRFEASWRL